MIGDYCWRGEQDESQRLLDQTVSCDEYEDEDEEEDEDEAVEGAEMLLLQLNDDIPWAGRDAHLTLAVAKITLLTALH